MFRTENFKYGADLIKFAGARKDAILHSALSEMRHCAPVIRHPYDRHSHGALNAA